MKRRGFLGAIAAALSGGLALRASAAPAALPAVAFDDYDACTKRWLDAERDALADRIFDLSPQETPFMSEVRRNGPYNEWTVR